MGVIMITTRGYAAQTKNLPLQAFQFERREPKPDDILIEIAFCGICHSDIHTARGEWGPTLYPCVPGHEIVGKIIQVGKKVKEFKVGDFAGVGCFVDSCGKCPSCKNNEEQFCIDPLYQCSQKTYNMQISVKKIIIAKIIAVVLFTGFNSVAKDLIPRKPGGQCQSFAFPKTQLHRGYWTSGIPENTIADYV